VDASHGTQTQCIGSSSNYLKNRYNSSRSTSYQRIGERVNITYGAGFAYVETATETLNLAGISVSMQQFGRAVDIDSKVFGNQPFDGILGLGWHTISLTNSTPPIENMLGQLTDPMFTIWLDPSFTIWTISSESPAIAGQITFGGFDNAHCNFSTLHYANMVRLGYWEFDITGVAVGNLSMPAQEIVITDTGTSFIIGPDDKVRRIAQALDAMVEYNPTSGMYTIPCIAKPLPVNFMIAGKNLSVTHDQYIIDMDIGGGLCMFAFLPMGPVDSSYPKWILGDPFCRSYCQVHDIGRKRIGFADHPKSAPTAVYPMLSLLMLSVSAAAFFPTMIL